MIAVAAFALLGIAALLATVRLVIGPSLGDRIAALDVILISLMSAIAVDAAARNDTSYLGALIVIAVVGFTTTVATSRFIEHHGNGA